MSLVLQSSGGGSITVQEPATASNFTQTLPAATGTVALTNAPVFTGQATIPTINLTGGQITFPATQSASSDANTLDDYEEGTFTANLSDGTNNVPFTGTYIKVGRLVTIAYSAYTLNISALTVTGNQLRITGIPFTAALEHFWSNGGLWANSSGLNYFISLSVNTLNLWFASNITDVQAQTRASLGNPTTMSVFGAYTYIAS